MSALLADIASGETEWADIFFLIAVILAVLSVVARFVVEEARGAFVPLLSGAVGAMALGLLVL